MFYFIKLRFLLQTSVIQALLYSEVIRFKAYKTTASNCFCGMCSFLMVRPGQDPLQYFHYTRIPLKLPLKAFSNRIVQHIHQRGIFQHDLNMMFGIGILIFSVLKPNFWQGQLVLRTIFLVIRISYITKLNYQQNNTDEVSANIEDSL